MRALVNLLLVAALTAQAGPEIDVLKPLPLGKGPGPASAPITFSTCRPIVFPQAELVYPRSSSGIPINIGVIAVSVLVEGISHAQITLTPTDSHLPTISVQAREDQDFLNPLRSDLHAVLPMLAPATHYLLHISAHDGTKRCGAEEDYPIDLGEIYTSPVVSVDTRRHR